MKELLEHVAAMMDNFEACDREAGAVISADYAREAAADLRKLAETAELRDEAWAAMVAYWRAKGVTAAAIVNAVKENRHTSICKRVDVCLLKEATAKLRLDNACAAAEFAERDES